MTRRIRSARAVRLLLLLVLVGLVPMARPGAQEPLRLVASMSVVADMVRVVGGERVAVTTLVGPDGDAHAYQPRPSDARAVAEARAVVINGLGLEGWIARLMQSADSRATLIVATEGTTHQTVTRDAHGHGHGPGAVDPHAWQNLANGQIYVANIARGLAAVDPAHAALYRRNAEAYGRRLGELDQWVRATIASVPEPRRKAITTHDAFGYFGAAYGIRFLAPVGLSTDNEPTAAGMAQLVRQMKREGIKALFVENISDPRLLEQLARDAGAVIGGKLYADALSAPGGPAASYVALFEHNATVLARGMARN
jgi:zinc/manganese transport system substrate-binding protein